MRTLRGVRAGLVLSALMSLLVVVPLEGQRGPPMGRRGQGADRAELERRVRARMAEMMEQQLGLGEEEGARLSEIVEAFEQQRGQLGREEQALRRRVEALMLEGGEDQIEAAELLERMSALRIQEAELFQAEVEALHEILTSVQVLQYISLRDQLGQRIRRLRGQPGRGGGGPAGDGRWGVDRGPMERGARFGETSGV